jgi:hypothetical protein
MVAQVAKDYQIDILAFCEVGAEPDATIMALKPSYTYHFSTGLISDRIHLFTRFLNKFLTLHYEAERFLIFEVKLPEHEPFLFMVLHAPSKASGWTPPALALEMARYVPEMRRVEASSGILRSIVVGDFNANPFEPGLVGASGFNAVMDRRIANRGERTVQEQSYRYFYNPMWNLYGDATPGPPATFFHSGSTQEELYWHMLDQVIVSPEMIPHLDIGPIKILDTIGNQPLITKSGRPKKSISDHLPLYFELNW